jgi:CubicO group peptidase (beta-lactamase class C family)
MIQQSFIGIFLLFLSSWVSAQEITQQLDNYLSRTKKREAFHGTALIVHKGNILLYKGYGYKNLKAKSLNDTATLYRIGSLSKPFTAAVILRLVELQALTLKDPVSTFLPGYPQGGSITIEQLLTHSSGVKEYLEIKAIQQLPDSAPPISLDKLIAYFSNEPLVIRPGEKFAYSNSNYILLSAIIEKITGKKFEHLVRQTIFEPLAMHHSGFDFKHVADTNKSTGHLSIKKSLLVSEDFDSTYAPGCGSMYSTAKDIFRWYRGLYNGKVIADSTREQAFARRQSNYGYGWFNEKKHGKKCISHAGGVPGFVANLQFYPDEDLCVILLSNSTNRDIFTDSDKMAAMVLKKK